MLQSARDAHYTQALQTLIAGGHIFYCNCSRKLLRQQARNNSGAYPGYCRNVRQAEYRPATAGEPASHAIRFATSADHEVTFEDRVLGWQRFELDQLGDFIVRRRDSLFAYQLAVVVDDAEQGITDVVRGVDLLASTPWQILLQRALGLATPRYAHLPLLVNRADHSKLSKQTGAPALDNALAYSNLYSALAQLGQTLPDAHTAAAGANRHRGNTSRYLPTQWRTGSWPRYPLPIFSSTNFAVRPILYSTNRLKNTEKPI